MASYFAKKPAAKEILRDSKRDLSHAQRDMEKEIITLQAEEKKLVLEIKKVVKSGNQASARILAKDLVRLRAQITKLHCAKTSIRGVSSKIQAASANNKMAEALKSSGAVMGAMNKHVAKTDPVKTAQMFQMENARMEHAQELMGDAMDDALDEGGLDEEADEYTNQILDEIGVSTAAQMASVSRRGVSQRHAQQDREDGDLERQLKNLGI